VKSVFGGKICDFPAKIPHFSEIKKNLGKIQTLKRSSKWLNSPWMHCIIIKIDGLIFVSNFAWQLNFICYKRQFWPNVLSFFFMSLGNKVHYKWLFSGKWHCLSFVQD
jgi:hypothetical protein